MAAEALVRRGVTEEIQRLCGLLNKNHVPPTGDGTRFYIWQIV